MARGLTTAAMTAPRARPRSRTLRRVLGVVCLLGPLLAAAPPRPALGQTPGTGVLNDASTTVVLRGEPTNVDTYVPPLVGGQGNDEGGVGAVASFQPTYNGVPAAAQSAFQRAVDIWAANLNSTVPVQMVVTWTNMGPGMLGATSYSTTRDFGGAPLSGTYYPVSLANALSGTDLNPELSDMSIDFNSGMNWYFGTGVPPSGSYDFTSVALHEIGHGLGFAGSMRVTSGQGRWGSGTPAFPDIYDRFATDSMRRALLNTSTYPNPSSALATALTSGNIFFESGFTNAADGSGRPKLYAPATWTAGSSYSHLDEATYGPGNPNSLMTPSLNQTEVVHSPGALTLCIFKALGWSTSQTCPPAGAVPPANDNLVNAQTINGATGSVANGTNVNATKQAGEPNHAGNAGGHSVWFRWTASSAAPVRFDTAGSNFDTTLAVYTGTAVSSLNLIASNDDTPGLAQQSRVTFTPVSGQIYRIAVDGWDGAMGTINLQWGPSSSGTTSISPTSLETGQSFTTSATGVSTPNVEYRLRVGTAAETCASSGIVVGGTAVSSASRNIAAVQRTVPNDATTGGRWFCWISADDDGDSTAPIQVTIF